MSEQGRVQDHASPVVDDLVRRLAEGTHPVTASPGNHKDWHGIRERIEIGVVQVTFVDTRTQLGVRLTPALCDVTSADFEHGSGTLRLVGTLVLNDVPVRCTVDLDLPGLSGTGRLEIAEG